MAKSIYICRRDGSKTDIKADTEALHKICNLLLPDNLSSTKQKVFSNGDNAYVILNYQPFFKSIDHSFVLGHLYKNVNNWHEIGSQSPEGNFAIFRNNEQYFEAVSDILATRTIWYYHDADYFIASTSQRPIVMYLGSFEFDDRVIPWMLSTGTIGPEYSWDKRIKKLRPDSSVLLNKLDWTIAEKHNPFSLNPKKKTDEEHKNELRTAAEGSIKSLKKLNLTEWPITLSGGYDSRAILFLLKKNMVSGDNLHTLTYGLQKSLKNRYSDAFVANKLAEELETNHSFHPLNRSDEPFSVIFDRYLKCGEGRIDHISAYMDGMKIWNNIAESKKIKGVLRGDVIFFPYKTITELHIRHHLGCPLCSDLKNMESIIQDFDFPEQKLSDFLDRKPGESIDIWCDRLYHYFRYPTIHGALNDIKLSYTEVINPFISRQIIDTVYQFPDHLRKNKKIFMELVDSLHDKTPYASRSSTENSLEIFRDPEVVQLIITALQTAHSKALFGEDFIDFLTNKIKVKNSPITENKSGNFATIKKKIYNYIKGIYLYYGLNSLKYKSYKILPKPLLYLYEKFKKKPSADFNRVAFRCYMITRMTEILEQDTAILNQSYSNGKTSNSAQAFHKTQRR